MPFLAQIQQWTEEENTDGSYDKQSDKFLTKIAASPVMAVLYLSSQINYPLKSYYNNVA